MKTHVKKGDTVIVITGDNKGSQGTVLQVLPAKGRVLVEGDAVGFAHVGTEQVVADDADAEPGGGGEHRVGGDESRIGRGTAHRQHAPTVEQHEVARDTDLEPVETGQHRLGPARSAVEQEFVAVDAGDPHPRRELAGRIEQQRPRRARLDERLDVLADLTLEELRGVGTRGPHDVTLEPCTDDVAHRLSLPCRLPPQHRAPSN